MSKFKKGDKVRQVSPFAYNSVGYSVGTVVDGYEEPADFVEVDFNNGDGSWPLLESELELAND